MACAGRQRRVRDRLAGDIRALREQAEIDVRLLMEVFFPTLLLALYWPRMTRNGALAGILGGGVTVVLWKQLEGGIFGLYEIIPGFLVSTAAIVLFSLLEKQPSNEILKEYQRVKSIT